MFERGQPSVPTAGGRQPRSWSAPRAALWGISLAQLFWALMLLGHMPTWTRATVSLLSDPDGYVLLRWAILTASQVFFIFKLLDHAWVRLPQRRHAGLVLTLVIVLLHADVLRHLWQDAERAELGVNSIALVAAATVVAVAVHRSRRHERRASSRIGRMLRTLQEGLRRLAEPLALPPREAVLVRSCRPNRAPPR